MACLCTFLNKFIILYKTRSVKHFCANDPVQHTFYVVYWGA